jgi:hypothetical protein
MKKLVYFERTDLLIGIALLILILGCSNSKPDLLKKNPIIESNKEGNILFLSFWDQMSSAEYESVLSELIGQRKIDTNHYRIAQFIHRDYPYYTFSFESGFENYAYLIPEFQNDRLIRISLVFLQLNKEGDNYLQNYYYNQKGKRYFAPSKIVLGDAKEVVDLYKSKYGDFKYEKSNPIKNCTNCGYSEIFTFNKNGVFVYIIVGNEMVGTGENKDFAKVNIEKWTLGSLIIEYSSTVSSVESIRRSVEKYQNDQTKRTKSDI